jgi:hypothetical protein
VLSGLRIEVFRQCDQCGCTFPPEDGDAPCRCDECEGRPGQWQRVLPAQYREAKPTAFS